VRSFDLDDGGVVQRMGVYWHAGAQEYNFIGKVLGLSYQEIGVCVAQLSGDTCMIENGKKSANDLVPDFNFGDCCGLEPL
jgi:hypothetical protein